MTWLDDRERLIDAMVRAEGGEEAFVKAVRCSVQCADYAEARRIATNTITHRSFEFSLQHPEAFIAYLGSKWAPVGAENDPTDLNANWSENVRKIYLEGGH